MDADILIVGGGSAGSVLAGRLSARDDRRVVLVEAGRDLPPGRERALASPTRILRGSGPGPSRG